MVDARSSFEQSVFARMMEGGFLEIEIRTECLRRCGDGYQDEIINAGWHYWQASRRKALEDAEAVAKNKSQIYKVSLRVKRNDHDAAVFESAADAAYDISATIRALIEKEAG